MKDIEIEPFENASKKIRSSTGDDETFCNETLFNFTDFEWEKFADTIENYAFMIADKEFHEKFTDEAHDLLMRLGKNHLMAVEQQIFESEMEDAA